MSTLLMRLAAPMQSWGIESKFDLQRDTGREPSKSGVIGLVAAALGIRRDEDEKLAQLAKMRFGVRVDREGTWMRDYHTASNAKATSITNRHYLADAVFVVGLESEEEDMLQNVAEALKNPVYPLYLGRRSCPPMGKVFLCISPESLENALESYPCTVELKKRTRNVSSESAMPSASMRMVLEVNDGSAGRLVRDVPASFNPRQRLHAYRRVVEKRTKTTSVEHDPMAELEE